MARPRVTARSFVLYCVAFAAAAATASRADGTQYEKIPLGAIFEQGSDEVQAAFKLALFQHNQNNTERRFELQAYVDVIKTADAFKLSKLNDGKKITSSSKILLDWNLTGPKRTGRMKIATATTGSSGQKKRTLVRTKKPVGDKHCADSLEWQKTGKTDARPQWEGTAARRLERPMRSTVSSLEEMKGSNVMRSIEKSRGVRPVVRRVSRSTGSTAPLISQVMKSKRVKGSMSSTVTSLGQIMTKNMGRSMGSIVTSMGETMAMSKTKSTSLAMASLGQIKKRKLRKSMGLTASSLGPVKSKRVTKTMGLTMASLGQMKVRKVGRSTESIATSLGKIRSKGVTKSIGLTVASSLSRIKTKTLMKSTKSTPTSLKEITTGHVTISVDKSLGEWKVAKRVTRSNTGPKITDDEDSSEITGFARQMFTVTEVQDQTTVDNGLTLPCRIFVGTSKLRPKHRSPKRTRAPTTPRWNCVTLDYDEENYCPSKTSCVEPVTLSSCVPVSVQDPVTGFYLKTTTVLRDRMTDIAAK